MAKPYHWASLLFIWKNQIVRNHNSLNKSNAILIKNGRLLEHNVNQLHHFSHISTWKMLELDPITPIFLMLDISNHAIIVQGHTVLFSLTFQKWSFRWKMERWLLQWIYILYKRPWIFDVRTQGLIEYSNTVCNK